MINLEKYEVYTNYSHYIFSVTDILSPKSTNQPRFDFENKVKDQI
jgi:hypothetical protein